MCVYSSVCVYTHMCTQICGGEYVQLCVCVCVCVIHFSLLCPCVYVYARKHSSVRELLVCVHFYNDIKQVQLNALMCTTLCCMYVYSSVWDVYVRTGAFACVCVCVCV